MGGETGSLALLGACLLWLIGDNGLETVTIVLAHKYTDQTLPRTPSEDRFASPRDPSRLRGYDAVLYATIDKALTAAARSEEEDEDEVFFVVEKPPISVELINVRDFEAPEEGEAPCFNIGSCAHGEWWQRGGSVGYIANIDEFAQILQRHGPVRQSLYTGNEGMETGYIYTSAAIKLGASRDY